MRGVLGKAAALALAGAASARNTGAKGHTTATGAVRRQACGCGERCLRAARQHRRHW